MQIGLRIMPSQNTEGNLIRMAWSPPGSPLIDEMGQNIDSDDRFYYYNNTPHYFTTFHYTDDYVPVGTSRPVCLHLEYIVKDRYY